MFSRSLLFLFPHVVQTLSHGRFLSGQIPDDFHCLEVFGVGCRSSWYRSGAKIFDKNVSQTGVQLSVGSACCTPPSVVHKTHVCSKLSCCSKFYIYFIGAADQGVPCAVLLNQRNSEMAGANPRFFARFSIEIGLFLGGHKGPAPHGHYREPEA